MFDETQVLIFISYLALKAGITPEEFARLNTPSDSEEIKMAVEFWNRVIKERKQL